MDFTTLQNDFTNDYQKALIANNEFLEAKKYYNGNQLPQDVVNYPTAKAIGLFLASSLHN